MDAGPLLSRLVTALARAKLDTVLIGNAAAAMHGAPVTTLDFDFMFRDTPTNLRKLKAVAAALGAVILRPCYPASKLYRMVDDDSGLQADFMPVIHGVRSLEGLRSRAVEQRAGGVALRVASLHDIIASKKAAGRERDVPCCRCWSGRSRPRTPRRTRAAHDTRATRSVMPRKKTTVSASARRRALAALRTESDRQLEDLIRRRLALPVEKRMNFLRRRLPGGGSCL